jgi:hypothetical protein
MPAGGSCQLCLPAATAGSTWHLCLPTAPPGGSFQLCLLAALAGSFWSSARRIRFNFTRSDGYITRLLADFFEIVNKIDLMIKENEHLTKSFEKSSKRHFTNQNPTTKIGYNRNSNPNFIE